tara:strand:+ start:144 stop:512 length:369 start_codon:yes stop_codon:yes gene_type:complete
MNKKDKILMDVKTIFDDVVKYYGYSKYQNTTPFIEIEDSPYSDADDPNLIGEYCNLNNSLIVYWKNIKSKEQLIRTIVHEYKHYLQSPSWMTRYYNMGYNYSDHPYEVEAYNEEENWKLFKN